MSGGIWSQYQYASYYNTTVAPPRLGPEKKKKKKPNIFNLKYYVEI